MDHDMFASTTETKIRETLASVLKVESVGGTDNFFALGLDSLLVIEAVTRLEGVLEMEVPIVAFFDHPTSHALATALDEAAPSGRLKEPAREGRAT